MTAVNITRSARFENGVTLSGSEAPSVEIPAGPDQAISAATEEEVTIAFQAVDLQALALLCDQAVGVQILETRFALTSSTDGGAGIEGILVCVVADVADEIFAGDLVRIEGTVANDGVYLVESVVADTINFANGQELPATEGVVGTVCRVANRTTVGYSYALDSSTAAGGVLVVVGNITDKFAPGDWLEIQGTVGNNGLCEVVTVNYAAPDTTITVNGSRAPLTLPQTEAAVGGIVKSNPSIILAAHSPYLWSIDGGLQNPLIHRIGDFEEDCVYNVDRGNVVAIMVDNTDNAVAAQFDARVATNSNIF